MSKLNNDFLLLEREVTGSGMDLEPGLAADMKKLKENWLNLLEEINTEEVRSPAELVVSLGTISTTTSQEMMASPSTQSVSPLSDEVASSSTSPVDSAAAAARCKQVSAWLCSLGKLYAYLLTEVPLCLFVSFYPLDILKTFCQKFHFEMRKMLSLI